jgi:hypothetical protein
MAKDESYTPSWVINAVTSVLGSIELDPTSNGLGGIATHSITAGMDCFKTDWRQYLTSKHTVFLNPPYSKGGVFVKALWNYLDSGVVKSAITLTLPGLLHNKNDSWMFSSPYCRLLAFPTGRINYHNNGKSNDRDALIALWSHNDKLDNRFIEVFQNLKAPLGSGSRVTGALITRPFLKIEDTMQVSLDL